ncbi:hypothetical protein J7K03_00820 [bacterium]|nr:hypothetical protein [bacterium]
MIYLLILAFPIMIVLNKVIADNSVKVFSIFVWTIVGIGLFALFLVPIVLWGKINLLFIALIFLAGIGFYIWMLLPREK